MVELKPPPAQAAWHAGSAVPGWSMIAPAVAGTWLLLASLALGAGIVWRIAGYAPPLFSALDGAGLALWCSALFLWPVWQRLQRLQARHYPVTAGAFARHYLAAARLAAYSVPLSLAALGVLPAYSSQLPIARILTLDQFDVPVPAGTFVLITLMLFGPTIVCLSLALLSAGRSWLGHNTGTLFWALALLLANSNLLGSLSGQPQMSLGYLAEWLRGRMNLINFEPTETMYLSDLAVEALVLPFTAFVLSVVLLAWSAIRPESEHGAQRQQSGWIAFVVALGAVGLAAVKQAGAWSADTSVTSPGEWQGLFSTGVIAAMVAFTILTWSSASKFVGAVHVRSMGWVLAGMLMWVVYTLPNYYAGQPETAELASFIGFACFICATLMVLVLMTVKLLSSMPAVKHIAFTVLLAITAIPVDPEHGSVITMLIRQLHVALLIPAYRELAVPIIAILAVVLLGGLALLLRQDYRLQPRPSK